MASYSGKLYSNDGSNTLGGNASLNTFKLTNTSGTNKWYFSLGVSDELEIRNASNVVVLQLSQTGVLKTKDDVWVFSTLV